MPTTVLAPLNPFDGLCTYNNCLKQVVGYIDHNPQEQYAACISSFGAPTVVTVTPTVDVVFATATTTISYVDVIVSLTTQTSTVEETVTSYDTLFQTATEYTTTRVATVSATTYLKRAPTVVKRKHRKRGDCHIKPSSTLASSTIPTTPASEYPAWWVEVDRCRTLVASNCANLEEYSSACSCITAVEATETVTAAASTSTSIVYETVSKAVPSVSESTVNVVVTTVIVKPATATVATTVRTALESTTTALTTIQTGQAVLEGGDHAGAKLDLMASSFVKWSRTTAATIVWTDGQGDIPYLSNNPASKLWLQFAGSYGILYFGATAPNANFSPVSCAVNSNGYISCRGTSNERSDFNSFFSCASQYVIIAPSNFGWTNTACKPVNLKFSAV
ncbi:hypothetical protein QBC38DRAFT_504622 [Podospora fimiseda]|uniref:Uncharacterized protein n=1 Tax=Podospora fimiseda TaxID=252190 RepID=A0AAN6YPH5_9PEZI|nr:hypothetical protein QBC38DRAFT_504622 [Podospora fimiseda]